MSKSVSITNTSIDYHEISYVSLSLARRKILLRDMVIGPQQVSYVLMISDYAMILYYHTFYESTKVINIRRLLARLHRR